MTNVQKRERQKAIMDCLVQTRRASVKELAEKMSVSEMTIRRDLYSLREQNLILYISGVAIYNSNQVRGMGGRPYRLTEQQQLNNEKKRRIGEAAASMIVPGDTIIIDTGSTTEELVRFFPHVSPCTVLCYNVNILNGLIDREGIDLMVIGGVYHRNAQMFESPEGVSFIKRTRASKLFISAAGISEFLGLTCVNQYEIEVKRASLQVAQEKILLADSSKFDQVRPALFGQLSELDCIVTDDEISDQWVNTLEHYGIKLVVC